MQSIANANANDFAAIAIIIFSVFGGGSYASPLWICPTSNCVSRVAADVELGL
jgi:hypothetical protein